MAKIVSRSTLIGRLKSYVSKKLFVDGLATEEDTEAYLGQLEGANDRTTVFVVTGLVAEGLRVALDRRLPNSEPSLYADRGLLSDLYARNLLAYSLGIVDVAAKHDLDAIRELRNAAAHGLFQFNFTDEHVQGVCLSIEAQRDTKFEVMANPSSSLNSPAGTRFILAGIYYFTAIGSSDIQGTITPNSHSLSSLM